MNKTLKLNQVIAIANGQKSRKEKILSKVYHTLEKADLFQGLAKRYTPKDEEGDRFPNEDKQIQTSVFECIKEAREVCEDMYNICATQDVANCNAKADVVVDGKVILNQVPVTHLLFLEKQLTDLHTFVNALPVLDPAENWTWKEDSMQYVSDSKDTFKTKKVMKNHVKAEATDKHPAQVEVYTEDIVIGTWATTKFSGCIAKQDKEKMLEKIRALDKAIKVAREEANSIEVTQEDFGTKLLDFVFEK